MKSHLLRLEDLLLFEGLDDLLLLELEDPPFLPLDPLELSSLSGKKQMRKCYIITTRNAALFMFLKNTLIS